MSTATDTTSSPTPQQDVNNNNNNSNSNSSSSSNNNNDDSSTFECNICLETAEQPVITMCGHLFCWPCIYKWMQLHLDSPQCPVCKSGIATEKLIPLYGRGKETSDPRTKIPEGMPNRPSGHHAEPTPQHPHYPQFGMFPGGPMASAQFGNISLSAGIGFFPSLFGLQFQTYPNNGQYPNQNGPPGEQDQQAVLSRLLFMLAMLVLFFLLFF